MAAYTLNRLKLLTLLFALLSGLVLGLVPAKPAEALSGSSFQPGRIIDDEIFFNSNTMNMQDIQNFLNAKVPVCDTWGTQPRGGTTRAAYGASVGNPAPYVCLKDFVQIGIPEKPAENGLCTGVGAGTKSAAEIIYVSAKACGINPQALLVLLQKEQSLVTDDWPWPIQYRSATGYGCPDTAPCDAEYYGFFNQVYNASRQFKRYIRDAHLFSYRAGRDNHIQWSPNGACGGGAVFIKNNATAALYNYTPYQPNAAALANLYGTGDGCSAYGNRNFWRLFHDWFGSTLAGECTANEPMLPYVRRFYHPITLDHFYSARDCDVVFLQKIGYRNEGPAYNTTSPAYDFSVPVYRYYNPQTQMHMWSTLYETPEQLAAGGSGYRHEAGIVFYVIRGDIPSAKPVSQFYNPNTYRHLWAANPSQADKDFLYHKAGFLYEGTSFFSQ